MLIKADSQPGRYQCVAVLWIIARLKKKKKKEKRKKQKKGKDRVEKGRSVEEGNKARKEDVQRVKKRRKKSRRKEMKRRNREDEKEKETGRDLFAIKRT